MDDIRRNETDQDSFNATDVEYQSFMFSHIWMDMKTVIKGWKDACLQDLSDPNKVNTLEALADMQGRIYICDLMLSFPETAIETIKYSKLNQKENENDSSKK